VIENNTDSVFNRVGTLGPIVPPNKSVLRITTDFLIYFQKPKPNRWVCFWQRVLLGWTWLDV
jgi:hypothetical protein